MGLWKRPELIWRAILVVVLALAGLIFLPPRSVPSSTGVELSLPENKAGTPISADLDLNLPKPASGPKLVALTFDDGPKRSTTTDLLDGLKERGVQASFFLVGSQIREHSDLVLRMAQEGHQVGVHTFDHVRVTGLDYGSFVRQVEGTRWQLYELLGEQEFWLRPPYGILDENVKRWADSPVILWSVDPEDWKDDDVERIKNHVLSRVQDGDIILMHDIYNSSVEAALAIVDALQQEGYRFLTVEKLLERRGICPELGCVYKNAPEQFRAAEAPAEQVP